jgi:phosphatidylinositol glycan class V
MVPWNAMHLVHNAPITSLLTVFTAWKLLLLTLAIVSPGPGYDTSTQLLFRGYGVNSTLPSSTSAGELLAQKLAQKLTRWDAIYFVTSAERGYQLEQEWAFGWGLTRAIAYLAKRKSFFASTKQFKCPCLNFTLFLANRGVILRGIACVNQVPNPVVFL